jgi:Flp pilus assembly protein TadB
MNAATTLILLFSSLCLGWSAYLSWYWLLPAVEKLGHKQVEPRIRRLSQIGYQEERIRFSLSLIEVACICLFVYLSVHYVGWLIGGLCLLILFHARPSIIDCVIRHRESELRRQVQAFSADLRHLAHGGLTLSQALTDAAFRTPQPLGRYVRRIVNEQRCGRPLKEAIASVRASLQLDAFSLLVTALNNSMTRGSSLVGSLTGVTETLQNAGQAEQQLEAKTSAGRTTVTMLSIMPVGFVGLFWLMNPQQFPLLFSTMIGQLLFCFVIALTYIGVAWARKLLTPDF